MSAWHGLANNRLMTQLPHYAVNKSTPEDTFFTDKKVAAYCYTQFERVAKEHAIDLHKYHFIDPAAGEGCFYHLLPTGRKTGLDINPRADDIQEADFLLWYPVQRKNYAVIGNPPFGVRGAYALAFLNRSLLFADVVAFILPMSFYSNGKGANMKRVENATLIHSERLAAHSFYTPDTKAAVSVNTVFQVWKKGAGKSVFSDFDVSEYVEVYTVCSAPERRCGMDKIGTYDCYISSTFYGDKINVVNSFDEVKYGSGYGIIIKRDKRKVMQVLKCANWANYASDATNHCKHLRMYSIRRCLGEAGFGVEV